MKLFLSLDDNLYEVDTKFCDIEFEVLKNTHNEGNSCDYCVSITDKNNKTVCLDLKPPVRYAILKNPSNTPTIHIKNKEKSK